MAKVGIVMGSDSDMPIMAKAADVLKELGIDFDMTIISAHREPEEFFAYAKGAEEKGYKVSTSGRIFPCTYFFINSTDLYPASISTPAFLQSMTDSFLLSCIYFLLLIIIIPRQRIAFLPFIEYYICFKYSSYPISSSLSAFATT